MPPPRSVHVAHRSRCLVFMRVSWMMTTIIRLFFLPQDSSDAVVLLPVCCSAVTVACPRRGFRLASLRHSCMPIVLLPPSTCAQMFPDVAAGAQSLATGACRPFCHTAARLFISFLLLPWSSRPSRFDAVCQLPHPAAVGVRVTPSPDRRRPTSHIPSCESRRRAFCVRHQRATAPAAVMWTPSLSLLCLASNW